MVALIQLPPTAISLKGFVWLQDIGQENFVNEEYAGTRGEDRRLEGFQLSIDPPVGALALRYMAYVENIGNMPWVDGGTFTGTRGQGLRLEGFAIQLFGDPGDGNSYRIEYMSHLQDTSDIGPFWDGQFCGTTGQGLRIEGLAVSIQQVHVAVIQQP